MTQHNPRMLMSHVEQGQRLRTLTVIATFCWALFTLINLLKGRQLTAGVDLAAGTLTLLTWAYARGDIARRYARSAHALLSVSAVALAVMSMLSGQASSSALWFLALLPLMAGYVLNARATLYWAGVGLGALPTLALIERKAWFAPQFLPTTDDWLLGRVMLLLLILAFAYTATRSFEAQLEALVAGERQLERTRDQALAAATAKSAFLANMSHEVRTPLNGILGIAQLLGRTHLTAEQRELVETLERSGQGLLGIVNQILDFSKLEAGKVSVHAAPLLVRQVLDDVEALFSVQARARGLKLTTVIADNCPACVAVDGQHLRQILNNLVSNAIKFTESGEVEVTAGALPNGLSITVRDTGPGLGGRQIAELFQSFSQIDGTSTRKHGGTGLGLAISRHLAEAMGGTLSVDSTPGVGSSFCVALPAPPAQMVAAPHRQASSAAWLRQGGLKVLVAEDNHVNWLVIQKILRHLGQDSDHVVSGSEAVEAVRSTHYDIVFMDIQMPDMDGLEATRVIRREVESQRQPWIVALTASVLAEQQAACRAAGMDDYLSKPLQIYSVSEALRRHAAATSSTSAAL